MKDFVLGAIAMASLVVGLYFVRSWRRTGDRFFLFFAASFLIEAANRALLAGLEGVLENSPVYFLIRLLSYALIVVAIVDKNARRGDT